MVGFLCSLWPWLLGGLLGWLLCGLLARRMLRGPDIRGQLTEKDAHIRRLTGEMTALQARPPVQVEKIVEKIVEKPVDRVVEKFVDRPVDRVVEKVVERPVDRVVERIVEKYVDRPVDRIVEKIVDRPVDRVVEKIVDRPVDRIVEKVVEKQVDSPALLARVATLTAEVAVIAGLRNRIQQFESTPPKVVEKIVEKPVDRIVEKIVEKPVDRIVEKIVDRPVDRIVEKIVEKPVDRIVEKIVDRPVDRIVEKIVEKPVDRVVEKIVEKIVEKPVDRIVEKIVEKPVDRVVEKIVDRPIEKIVEKIVEKKVDNPAQAARIAALTAEVAVIAGLRGRIQQLESAPPKIVEKILEKPVERIVEKIVEKPVDRIVEKIVDRPVDRIVEKIVEKPVDRIVEKIVEKPVDRIVEKIVDRPVDRIVEKTVEKLVDNPATLSRIAALTAEVAVVAGLRSRIQQLESTPPKVVEKIVEKPVDRVVEKIVDRPVDRIVEKIVEKPVDRIVEKIVDRPVDRIVEKIVDRPVDRIVEKTVEKLVDNPATLSRIAALTAEVAVVAGLRSRIQQLESTPPKVVEKIVEKPVDRVVEKIVDRPVERIVEKIVEKPVDRIVEKIVDRPVDRIVEKIVEKPVDRIVEKIVEKPVDRVVEKIVDRPVDRIVEKIVEKPVDRIVEKTVEKLVPDTKGLEERDLQLADWRRRYGELEVQLRRAAEGPELDLAAARAAGFTVKGADDLELIEGIGPKIAELLRNAGIRTFAQLADTPTAKIQSILDAGGSQYRIANPGTWAEQADLAARNRWATLKQLHEVLDAGVRVDVNARSAASASELAALKQQLAEREAELKRLREGQPADLAAAKAAGFALKGRAGFDDLEIIEGIGPKIAGLLNDAGVTRFYQLAAMQPAQIQPILDAAGPAFKLARPDTWPEQAGLAARNQWVALKALQDALNAGNRT